MINICLFLPTQSGVTVLMMATKEGFATIVKQLLDAGAAVDSKNSVRYIRIFLFVLLCYYRDE